MIGDNVSKSIKVVTVMAVGLVFLLACALVSAFSVMNKNMVSATEGVTVVNQTAVDLPNEVSISSVAASTSWVNHITADVYSGSTSWQNVSTIADHLMSQYATGGSLLEGPYEIRTAEDLVQLAYLSRYGTSAQWKDIATTGTTSTLRNATFILTNNIDLSGYTWEQTISGFKGIFDGNGKTITGLTITGNTTGALFDSLSGYYIYNSITGVMEFTQAEILNLTLADVFIYSNNNTNSRAALVGGYMRNATINNCHASGLIASTRYAQVGGLVRSIDDLYTSNSYTNTVTSENDIANDEEIDIIDCTSSMTIITADGNAGGILGGTNDVSSSRTVNINISGCEFSGAIYNYSVNTSINNNVMTVTCGYAQSNSNDNNIGGIAGYVSVIGDINLLNCNNTGDIYAYNDIGGIVGAVRGTTGNISIDNCINTGDVIAHDYIGGVVGFVDSYNTGVVNSFITNCRSVAYISGNYEVGGIAGRLEHTSMKDCQNYLYNDVALTYTASQIISTYTDCGGYVGNIQNNYPYSAGNYYSGEEDGGVVLSGLINYASLGNVGISTDTSGTQFGGIAGWARYYITFENCENYGSITAVNDSRSDYGVGGILGKGDTNITIDSCTNHMDLTAPRTIGGIVGLISGSYTINSCTNFGNITATNTSGYGYASGIISHDGNGATYTNMSITNCVNNGAISGTGSAAGMARNMYAYNVVLTSCTNNGDIYSDRCAAGLLNWTRDTTEITSACTISSCENYGKVDSAIGCASGIGYYVMTNAVISNVVNHANINSTLSDNNLIQTNDSYIADGCFGYLRAVSLTNVDNYGNIRGNAFVAGVVGRLYSNSYTDATFTLCRNFGNLFSPKILSSSTYTRNYFYMGGIVANTNTYTNGYLTKYINCSNTGYLFGASDNVGGIVGSTSFATFDNCSCNTYDADLGQYKTYVGYDYSINSASGRAGGLVGSAIYAKFSNCSVNTTINVSSNYAGGLVAYSLVCQVSNCEFTGELNNNSTGQSVGGIVGQSCNLLINDCQVDATINSLGNYVGGIVGFSGINTSGDFYNSYKSWISKYYEYNIVMSSTYDNDDYIDWIYNNYYNNCAISNCTVTGEITDMNSYLGGIAGQLYATDIINCTNNFDFEKGQYNYVGGIVGGAYRLTYTSSDSLITLTKSCNFINCENNADITDFDTNYNYYGAIGGIAGYSEYVTISNCRNYGNIVSHTNYVAGIIGRVYYSISMSKCFNEGDITTTNANNTGGIIALLDATSGNVTLCEVYNKGNVSASNIVGGLIGYHSVYQTNSSYSITNCYNMGSVFGGATNGVGMLIGYISYQNYSSNNTTKTTTYNITNSYSEGNISNLGSNFGIIIGRVDFYYDSSMTQTINLTNVNYYCNNDITGNGVVGYFQNSNATKKVASTDVYNLKTHEQTISTVESSDIWAIDNHTNAGNGGFPYLISMETLTVKLYDKDAKLIETIQNVYRYGGVIDLKSGTATTDDMYRYGYAFEGFTLGLVGTTTYNDTAKVSGKFGDVINFYAKYSTPLTYQVSMGVSDGITGDTLLGESNLVSINMANATVTAELTNDGKDFVSWIVTNGTTTMATISFDNVLDLTSIFDENFIKNYVIFNADENDIENGINGRLYIQPVYVGNSIQVTVFGYNNGTLYVNGAKITVSGESQTFNVGYTNGEETSHISLNAVPDTYYSVNSIIYSTSATMENPTNYTAEFDSADNIYIRASFVETDLGGINVWSATNDFQEITGEELLSSTTIAKRIKINATLFESSDTSSATNTSQKYTFVKWVIYNSETGEMQELEYNTSGKLTPITVDADLIENYLVNGEFQVIAIHTINAQYTIQIVGESYGSVRIYVNNVATLNTENYVNAGTIIEVRATADENYSVRSIVVSDGYELNFNGNTIASVEVGAENLTITVTFSSAAFSFNVVARDTSNATLNTSITMSNYIDSIATDETTPILTVDTDLEGYNFVGWFIYSDVSTENYYNEALGLVSGGLDGDITSNILAGQLIVGSFMEKYQTSENGLVLVALFVQRVTLEVELSEGVIDNNSRYTLEVLSNGEYTALDDTRTFDYGTVIRITSNDDDEFYSFVEFDGSNSGEVNGYVALIVMNADRYITVIYDPEDLESISAVLSNTSDARGKLNVNEPTSLELNDIVVLTFTANAGYEISSWKIKVGDEYVSVADLSNDEDYNVTYESTSNTVTVKITEQWLTDFGQNIESEILTQMNSTYLMLLLASGGIIILLLLVVSLLQMSRKKKKQQIAKAIEVKSTQTKRFGFNDLNELINDENESKKE